MPKIEHYTIRELTVDPRIGRNGERPNKDYGRTCTLCSTPIHNNNRIGLCQDCYLEIHGSTNETE
jgi:hypothetical protein